MGGNGNSPRGNPTGMGISQKIGNGDRREWELNRWEREEMGMLKAIPAHLYSAAGKVNCKPDVKYWKPRALGPSPLQYSNIFPY